MAPDNWRRAAGIAVAIGLASVVCLPLSAAAILTQTGGASDQVTTLVELSAAELQAYDLQAEFRGFLATPIGPNHVLSAQHIGIDLADSITIPSGPDAGTYSIVTWYDDAGSDLRIIEINGTLSQFALLNYVGNEVGQTVVVFGRGGPPNGSVSANAELKGWTTAAGGGAISWGRNVIASTFGLTELRIDFDLNGLAREAGLSPGDSAGGWFIIDGSGSPRLAAISFRTSGPYSFDASGSPDGSPFDAVLFDRGGLWEGPLGSEVFEAENPQNRPGFGFGSRISDRISWIDGIVGLSEPDTDADQIPDGQDNCPYVSNVGQADTGSIGFASPPDGIGDACQCGDVSGDGVVTTADAFFTKRYGLGLNPFVFNEPGNCDVTGEGNCTGSDGAVVNAIASGLPAAIFGQHCGNALP